MKKILLMGMVMVLIIIGAGCSTQKTNFDKGQEQNESLGNKEISQDTGESIEATQIEEEEAMEDLKNEMVQCVQWVFENWQNFHYDTYDPSKYGLAFSLNFRLPYIFDNYDENVKIVLDGQIISQVKVQEIKDVGMAFNEEDHTLYAQVRIIAQYKQQINGKGYEEPVEILIFSKKHEDGNEGWEITNVDMYPTPQSSEDFQRLFFGFKKAS